MSLKRAEMILKTMDAEQEWINNEMLITSQAMLNIAKTEGEEAGIQYDEYSQQLDTLREMAKFNVDQMKNVQAQDQQQVPPEVPQELPA